MLSSSLWRGAAFFFSLFSWNYSFQFNQKKTVPTPKKNNCCKNKSHCFVFQPSVCSIGAQDTRDGSIFVQAPESPWKVLLQSSPLKGWLPTPLKRKSSGKIKLGENLHDWLWNNLIKKHSGPINMRILLLPMFKCLCKCTVCPSMATVHHISYRINLQTASYQWWDPDSSGTVYTEAGKSSLPARTRVWEADTWSALSNLSSVETINAQVRQS